MLVIILFLALLIYYAFFKNSSMGLSNTLSNKTRRLLSVLRIELRENGYEEKYSEYWKCTSAFETFENGKPFNSRLFKEQNNPWGMKQPLLRPNATVGVGTGKNPVFANYGSVGDAALDLVLYMNYFNYPKKAPNTLKRHVELMKNKGYFTGNLNEYIKGAELMCKEYV